MIEINHLCKSFGTLEVLKDISLTVKTGEIYGLVGRSGAGKSTCAASTVLKITTAAA